MVSVKSKNNFISEPFFTASNSIFNRQPRFGNWAFNVDRGQDILKKWNRIPPNIDVLIS